MLRSLRFIAVSLALTACLLLASAAPASQATNKGKVTELHFLGMRSFPEERLLAISGLHVGDLVGKEDLQAAADRLAQTGFFAKVNYEFRSKGDALEVNFRVEEAPRVPVLFDNIPWFTDSELADAIRKVVPVFDGTAPQDGAVLDQMAEAVRGLLEARGLKLIVEHQLLADPQGEGQIQEFHVTGANLKIGRIEFNDRLAMESRAIQQHVRDLLGKPYSRLTLEIFQFEQVRPVYLEKGYVRVRPGKPEVRLTANPNQPLPESIDVLLPIEPGAVYHWAGAQWSGNSAISSAYLDVLMGLRSGDVADGQKIQSAWEKISDDYARRGYLDATLDAQPAYDDAAHKVSYQVRITEGPQYRYGEMVVTGLSVAGEKKVRDGWRLPPGEVFDRSKFEDYLIQLQKRSPEIFGELPVHYDEVGHWLRKNPEAKKVDILLDFK